MKLITNYYHKLHRHLQHLKIYSNSDNRHILRLFMDLLFYKYFLPQSVAQMSFCCEEDFAAHSCPFFVLKERNHVTWRWLNSDLFLLNPSYRRNKEQETRWDTSKTNFPSAVLTGFSWFSLDLNFIPETHSWYCVGSCVSQPRFLDLISRISLFETNKD